jgi:hypothetical protein
MIRLATGGTNFTAISITLGILFIIGAAIADEYPHRPVPVRAVREVRSLARRGGLQPAPHRPGLTAA